VGHAFDWFRKRGRGGKWVKWKATVLRLRAGGSGKNHRVFGVGAKGKDSGVQKTALKSWGYTLRDRWGQGGF